MSRVEHFTKDPNYGRANIVPMKHPRLAKLDSNPPEEWYLSFRVNGRTLAEHARRESVEMQRETYDPGARPPLSSGRIIEIEDRRNAVCAMLTDTPQSSSDLAAAMGTDVEILRDDLNYLRRAKRAIASREWVGKYRMNLWRRA